MTEKRYDGVYWEINNLLGDIAQLSEELRKPMYQIRAVNNIRSKVTELQRAVTKCHKNSFVFKKSGLLKIIDDFKITTDCGVEVFMMTHKDIQEIAGVKISNLSALFKGLQQEKKVRVMKVNTSRFRYRITNVYILDGSKHKSDYVIDGTKYSEVDWVKKPLKIL